MQTRLLFAFHETSRFISLSLEKFPFFLIRSHINLPLQQAGSSRRRPKRDEEEKNAFEIDHCEPHCDVHAIYASSVKTATRNCSSSNSNFFLQTSKVQCKRKRKSFIAIPNMRMAKEEELCAR